MKSNNLSDKKEILKRKFINLKSGNCISLKTSILQINIYKGNLEFIVDFFYIDNSKDNKVYCEYFSPSLEGFNALIYYVLNRVENEEFEII